MTPTTEITARVNLCVGCHIGKAGQDVDHDLLAAGHPRLDFEFFLLLRGTPQALGRAAPLRDQADRDAQAWALGQAVSAREALGLLSLRSSCRRGTPSQETGGEFTSWDLARIRRIRLQLLPPSAHGNHAPLDPGRQDRTRQSPWSHWYDATASSLQPLPAKERPNEEENRPLASLRG